MIKKSKTSTLLEKKCLSYIRDNLKAPPQSLVFRWGKKLKLKRPIIQQINERLPLRANLGPDPGFLSNTKKWKKTTPSSFRSPYYAQGDIGFFSYNNKKYGLFFCAVQTFTGKIFAVPLRNTKTPSLIEAVEKLTRNKNFQLTKVLLFDGESGLRSKKAQNIIAEKFNIKIHAEAFFKRNMAERAIKEIKLRMAILLDLKKQPLTQWRNNLENVVNTINRNKKEFKSVMQMLNAFFTQDTVHLPQSLPAFYKFNINDAVKINVFPAQRKNLNFKYSLNIGKIQHNTPAVIKARRLVSKKNIMIPIYTVYIPSLDQVKSP